MNALFKQFKTTAVPAVPVVSVARGERVAGGGVVAAGAVQLGSASALTRPLQRSAAGPRECVYSNKGLAVVERKGRHRFRVRGG